MSTYQTTSQGTVLPQDDDILYEVADDKLVELGPMGAYEIWLATELVVYLRNFARQHQLGRAVQEMLFDFTAMVQRKRRPDVAFVSYERWPRQHPVPHAEAWEVVPNLVVEVISPSDKGNDILDKVRILTRADEFYGEPVLPHFRLPVATLFEDIEATEPPQLTAS